MGTVLVKEDRPSGMFFWEKMTKILLTGNEAMAKAAIEAGCLFYAGYPITPQNELTAYMAAHMPKEGRIFIQAESEIAAINMLFGASAAGARVMTSSSSPGISLKQEGISYLAGCQLPAVIINVMRVGPGLGFITPAQGDYFQATKGGGHGDYNLIVLAPSSVEEASNLVKRAFILADKYRNPVMILADAIIGQMMEPLTAHNSQSVVHREKQKNLSTKKWAVTGCRDREPNVIRSLFMDKEEMTRHVLSLQKKYKQVEDSEQDWEEENLDDAELVLVAYGSVARIAREAMKEARTKGIKVGIIRPISLWPFPKKAFRDLSAKTRNLLVIEMSAGQMVEDVQLAAAKATAVDFYGVIGGRILQSPEILKKIEKIIKNGKSIS